MMTIAEQIIRAKRDCDNVYTAGQKSMIDESKLLPSTVSGSYISLDDVSEVPHEVSCKISGVDNPENVKVMRCGRNLLNPNKLGGGELVEFNGIPCYKYRDRGSGETFPDTLRIEGCFKKNTQYSFTIKQYRNEGDTLTKWVIYTRYTDGTETATAQIPIDQTYTMTTQNGKTVDFIYSAYYGGTPIYLDLSVSCLNEGSTALPCEPYNGQTLTLAPDGTVEGMTSVSPYMNIFTDTDDANIEVTYNKSWGMQEAQRRFCDVFKRETIDNSISFERLTLSKESMKSVINALSPTATGQTVAFKKSAKEAAFTDDEWQALISTKPNWTFALL